MPSYAPRMADVPERGGLGRPATIAIGFAIVALLTSLAAVVVVLRRSGGEPAPPAATAIAAIDRTVDAAEVVKLKRDVVAQVLADDGSVIGVKVEDDRLRAALGLEPGDVIAALNGRRIERDFDVYDAVLGASTMNASIVYVELVRAKQPALVRWQLEGELATARRDPVRRTSVFGRSSPPSPSNPFLTPRDPLVDSIRGVGMLAYEIPRSTLDQLLANPDVLARQARIVPAIRNGQPDGFKLYAMRPNTLGPAIGLANGDTVRAINGHELSTPDRALELYTRLKDATALEILVRRRSGREDTISIAIK